MGACGKCIDLSSTDLFAHKSLKRRNNREIVTQLKSPVFQLLSSNPRYTFRVPFLCSNKRSGDPFQGRRGVHHPEGFLSFFIDNEKDQFGSEGGPLRGYLFAG